MIKGSLGLEVLSSPVEASDQGSRSLHGGLFQALLTGEFVTEGEARIEDKADVVGVVVVLSGGTRSPKYRAHSSKRGSRVRKNANHSRPTQNPHVQFPWLQLS